MSQIPPSETYFLLNCLLTRLLPAHNVTQRLKEPHVMTDVVVILGNMRMGR